MNLNGIGTLEHLGHLGHLDIGMLDIGTFRHESDRTIDGAWSEIMKEICSSPEDRAENAKVIKTSKRRRTSSNRWTSKTTRVTR